MKELEQQKNMYLPNFEHDACGIGLIAHIKAKRSHQMIKDGLKMLENMEHRGGCGSEPETGDGAGLSCEIPFKLFEKQAIEEEIELPEIGYYGVGVIFYPKEPALTKKCRSLFHRFAKETGVEIIWERKVPVNNKFVGPSAALAEPHIEHVFLKHSNLSGKALARKLFVLKKYAHHNIKESGFEDFYIASFSTNRMVFKGQLRSDQLRHYYKDFQNIDFESAWVMIHSRFSTNTFPKWSLAQPFRNIAHNGEINTIRGNVIKMKTKEVLLESDYFTKDEMDKILPICDPDMSDSANLDEVLELLAMSGRSLAHALMMLIPEAWQYSKQMDNDRKAFFKFHASLVEPWDGPAAICFTDGTLIGATLDRNGLRPQRYVITKDDRMIIASESGALPVEPDNIIKRGRLKPGHMICVDLEEKRYYEDEEIKAIVTSKQPYADWVMRNRIKLFSQPGPFIDPVYLEAKRVKELQQFHGYTIEDLKRIIKPMAKKGKEPIGSMGPDVPLAAFSQKPQHPANFLKQIFAQVSNPPIDPIRERMVMSLFTRVGGAKNLLKESPQHCWQVHISQPVLMPRTFQKVLELETHRFHHKRIDSTFKANETLKEGIDRLCNKSVEAVKAGKQIIILSDIQADADNLPIPSLLALGAVHHHLIKEKLRSAASLIVEAADVIEVQHYCTLIGYGASAVYPYLVFNSIKVVAEEDGLDFADLASEYIKAVGKGILKVMSKMGISTLQSYQAAQIFEAIGLGDEVIEKCFKGTTSRIGGIGFKHFENYVRMKCNTPLNGTGLPFGGLYQWKIDEEKHIIDPQSVYLLQKSLKLSDYNLFKEYSAHLNSRSEQFFHLRNLIKFKEGQNAIPIEAVEPATEIMKRFATGAMSFGSLSHEAHSTLAIAMNRIGAKSNSGEGGEDKVRYKKKENGDWERSAIKQVASGRFGVSSHYLNEADELQIKIAQGAKPGEGGQLPGFKVDEWIARVRNSTPGVDLISPPPHHDIYSIEDLAQLIFDLKNANPKARINVKLVAEAGVGTIAAGVAKGFADAILIAGNNGGTGASPLSSLMHAGIPWEMGLSEAHQTLVKNKLRSRVVLQTDGKLMTGRDIAIAVLLGAEEWGVSTAALIAQGCIMMRKCHENTCPVGVATQDAELRKLFTGTPEHVINLFEYLAEELREIMAQLGFKTINDMVGQSHLLEQDKSLSNAANIDLSKLLHFDESHEEETLYCSKSQQNLIIDVLDQQLIEDAKVALQHKKLVMESYPIRNTDRAVGTLLSSKISRKYGEAGLPAGTIRYKFKGSAGQSFGAFAAKGLHFVLEGDANDYFGKGLSGACLIVRPDIRSTFKHNQNTIIGNVALYGATKGEVYINGIAGERFAVRNSGVSAVVEGLGDHGCEYMTGGKVLVLGSTGKNFAAGMSGGIAYVYDPQNKLADYCNMEMVIFDDIDVLDATQIKFMLVNHLKYTKSKLAEELILNWDRFLNRLVKVIPIKYKEVLQELEDKKVYSPNVAELAI